MSHYEKLAVVIIRVIGCCVSIYAMIGMVYNALAFRFAHAEYAIVGIYSSFTYALVGVALFALSRPLAAFIARQL